MCSSDLPISYDVNIVPHGTLLDPANPQLLESTGVHPLEYNRRFAVIDAAVDEIYGERIRFYFTSRDIELHYIVLEGGELAKRPEVRSSSERSMCKQSPLLFWSLTATIHFVSHIHVILSITVSGQNAG